MPREKYYPRMSLEGAKKELRVLVGEKMRKEKEVENYRKIFHEKFPPYQYSWCSDEARDNKEYQAMDSKLSNLIKEESDDNRLFNLTHIMPIREEKKCCATCHIAICTTKNVCCRKQLPLDEYYCDDYTFPCKRIDWYKMSNIHFVTDTERAIEEAKTFDEKVEDRVKSELKEYEDCLKQTDELEASIAIEKTKPMPQEVLDEAEYDNKQIKASMDAFKNSFDVKTEKIKDGPLKGVYITSWTPNKKKFKKNFKKVSMCPMHAMAASLGLAEVPKEEKEKKE